jgi:hypothetical protein
VIMLDHRWFLSVLTACWSTDLLRIGPVWIFSYLALGN